MLIEIEWKMYNISKNVNDAPHFIDESSNKLVEAIRGHIPISSNLIIEIG